MEILNKLNTALNQGQSLRLYGKVSAVREWQLRASGLAEFARLGQYCRVIGHRSEVLSQIVSIENNSIFLLPFGEWDEIALGDKVELLLEDTSLKPNDSWIGSVVDAFGKPLISSKTFSLGEKTLKSKSRAPRAIERRRVGDQLSTQIKCIDLFTPLCQGQRIGIFSGAGVGKSSLISMLAKFCEVDLTIIALIGERGREVNELIERDLGPDGLARSIVVVSTSDDPPLTRRQAAYSATAIAEYFADEGKQVLLVFDSLTRFALAQREIGLASGEPPTSRGYPPSTFGELAKLLERAGPRSGSSGDITGVYSILVEGDDENEPVSDTARGILDGHIMLDRSVAEEGRFPAINLSKSLSRLETHCRTVEQAAIVKASRKLYADFLRIKDLLEIGAYQQGSDQNLDLAVGFGHQLEAFLCQSVFESACPIQAFSELKVILTGFGVTFPEPAS